MRIAEPLCIAPVAVEASTASFRTVAALRQVSALRLTRASPAPDRFPRRHTDLLVAEHSVLHVAPEYALQRQLRRLDNLDYRSADLDSPLAMDHVDLLDMPYGDESFDVVICNHVLEHVADDRRALREIGRVLRADGYAVIMSPIDAALECTLEDPQVSSPRNATESSVRAITCAAMGRISRDASPRRGLRSRPSATSTSLRSSRSRARGSDAKAGPSPRMTSSSAARSPRDRALQDQQRPGETVAASPV